MLLTMRRTEEPDRKGLRIKEEDPEDYYKFDSSQGNPQIWKEKSDGGSQWCGVSGDGNEDTKRKSYRKKCYVRQFGVEEGQQESEYVDITQVQQLLLDSAGSSGKVASDKNRAGEQQDCQQQYEATNRSLTLSEEGKAPQRPANRPHSQPSSSTYTGSQQPLIRSPDRYFPYPYQSRQLDYFAGKVPISLEQSSKPRMLAEGLTTSPHLLPPAPQTGGHSPNVEELFALWFGTSSGNAGWFS
ncbi:hypothetical protein RUM44_001375 [Polyplax serrata]|uniref:Uncharacterized protein n=1 Tax=Polyplax serrata TaxID=468196 RepID=A0ABR1AJU6_POLSC